MICWKVLVINIKCDGNNSDEGIFCFRESNNTFNQFLMPTVRMSGDDKTDRHGETGEHRQHDN